MPEPRFTLLSVAQPWHDQSRSGGVEVQQWREQRSRIAMGKGSACVVEQKGIVGDERGGDQREITLNRFY